MIGANANSKATNASNVLAHWRPRRKYIGFVARGRNAAKRFSPNATAAMAPAAQAAYSSVTYMVTACTIVVIANPVRLNPIAGTIQCD